MNNIELGRWGERQARLYLENKGYTIIGQNFRCSAGEIDIIAKDGEWIVFIEVKTRRSNNYGYPVEAVNSRKRMKYIQTALYYLKKHQLLDKAYRFDIVEVQVGKQGNHVTNHIINAFQSSRYKYFY